MNRILVTAALMLAVVASSLQAQQTPDTINRKSGKPQRGTVTEITQTSVTVKPGISDPVTIDANDIIDIEWGGGPGDLITARGAENSGNYDTALENYAKAEADASKALIKADIAFLIARTTAKIAMEKDATKLDDAAAKLDAFIKANTTSYRYFDAVFLLGRIHLARKDFTKAGIEFTRLAKAPWSDYKMAGQNANGRLAIARGDLPAAKAAYQAVLGLPATKPAEVSRRNEALLGMSAALIAEKNHQAALKSITEAITKADPEDSAVQAEAYVLKGDCLQSIGQNKSAILAYLHVPVLFEKEAMLNARALYHLTILWEKVEQPDRSVAARDELTEKYADTKWAKMLKAN